MAGEIKKDVLTAIEARLRAGSSALIQESKQLGFTHNGPLRSALKALLGEDGYNDLMKGKRPTTRSGGAISSVDRERPRIDDTGVPAIASMNKSDGWSFQYVSEYEPRPTSIPLKEGKVTVLDGGERFTISVSPEGKKYIRALDHEKADLVRPDIGVRLVEYDHSELRKLIEKHRDLNAEEVERGKAALERKRNKKATEEPVTISEAAGEKKSKKAKAPEKKAKAPVAKKAKAPEKKAPVAKKAAKKSAPVAKKSGKKSTPKRRK